MNVEPDIPISNRGIDIKPNDRLTELPNEIFSFILSFLSIRDAVKARVLSRRCRHVFPSILHLEFDFHSVLGTNYEGRHSNEDSDISSEARAKFAAGVDQFFEIYKGEKINSLRICFALGNEHACYVDRWIAFAIRRNTEKLDLDFSANQINPFYYFPGQLLPETLYDFPCQFLPEANTSQLKHLYLNSCNLRPAPHHVGRLTPLKTLDLENMVLDQSSAKSIFSGFLNLEWLRLKNISLPETFCIDAPSLHLETLILHDCYGVKKIEVSSIGLTTFEYIGRVKSFTFLNVPQLEKVHIRFMCAYLNGTRYMFNGLANDLPQLQTLSLVLTTVELLPVPTSIRRFNHLKQLELFVVKSSDFNLLSLTSLLNAAPLLQKFHVSLYWGRFTGPRREQLYSKHVHFQLKEVEVHGFLGSSDEMELAIYLLNNAVSLERMILSPQRRLYHGGGKWTSSTCYSFRWEPKQAYDLLIKEKKIFTDVCVDREVSYIA
ncbi:F-box/FBD/LRR-repeat protein At5g53840-like isoform X2 [Rhododendron vialii]|uniref:F-box/FBD/LRR-repeat protein At5g53840-like isoform X2 n=1 Tax=Rhododendron vialii TaxID=182163 RepID=UPI00265E33FF|nr:F-box/FBD/LRR-repeat protein At5g53840-like isoform X2 [Rhododendron vialii]